MKYVAKTISGLESILAQEIEQLGGQNVTELTRAVSFDGDLRTLYQVNLWSRTALRVIKPIIEFTAHNETVLYKRLRRYHWTDLFSLDQTFVVNSSVSSEIFTHSKYLSLKTKDAIVDQFRERNDGVRPSIDRENPDIVIDVHCVGKKFIISLDSSGRSLHRRGYRQDQRRAPLNEILATGLIMLAGWDGSETLYDPMCGSGTILTEAYAIAKNIAPGLNRDTFAFMNWADYDQKLWQELTELAKAAQKPELLCKIYGSDYDTVQVMETQSLLNEMGYTEIELSNKDFIGSSAPANSGVIITNPPYDMRIESDDIIGFYKSIGDTLKQSYSDWDAWIISGNKDAIKRLGLRTSQRHTLYNGSIECKYHKYEMYRGSKKTAKTDPEE